MQNAEITIRHSAVSGRIRLKVNALYRSNVLKNYIENTLKSNDCVTRFSINVLTGNVLVFHNHDSSYTTIILLIEKAVSLYSQTYPETLNLKKQVKPLITGIPLKKTLKTRSKAVVKAKKHFVSHAVSLDSSRLAEADVHWHTIDINQAVSSLKTSAQLGLSSKAAAERYALYGPNELKPSKPRSKLSMLIEQFTSLPVYLLGATAVISAVTGGIADALIICSVVGINAVIGYFTESHSEKAIESLRNTYKPDACVIRDGTACRIPAREVVIGDLLVLKPGVYIAADSRIINAHHLNLDESPLTGESLPVSKSTSAIKEKDNPLAERYNMVYTGTIVTGGYGKAIVTATGESTELGLIQRFIDNAIDRETPLERELDIVGRRIVLVCLGICGAVFGVGLLRGQPILQMLRSALSLAVAAVPEGLPAVATTTLAFGVTTMRRNNVLIRRLKAIEMLGNCSIICFDKTGTLTSNQMTVLSIHAGTITTELLGGAFITGSGATLLYDELTKLLQVCVLCSEVEIIMDGSKLTLSGSSTEKALVETAINAGCDVLTIRSAWPKEKMKYRSEKHNYMVGFHSHNESVSYNNNFEKSDNYLVTVKGNPQEVLELCGFITQNGSVRHLEGSDRIAVYKENGHMADRALRILGVAYGYTKSSSVMPEKMIWLGLIGMMDPVKEGVKELLRKFHIAGIKTVMITGDQNKTARSVAEQIGIAQTNDIGILDSSTLASLSDDELKDIIGDTSVFSRVSPVHKYRIVRLLQDDGRIVAMTGDGINDGPALKASDIGIAMGRSGTELAREAADVVLETDDLYAMYAAVKHSRTTYLNVRKSLRFLLSTNFSEIMVSFIALTTGLGSPLNIMQLLWINLITDVFPALALALEPPEPNIMEKPPRDSHSQLVGSKDLMVMLRESSVISAGGLAAYGYGLAKYGAGANAGSLSFMGLGLAQLLHSISCRREEPVLFNNNELPTNKYLNTALGGSILLQLLCPFIPGLRGLLGLAPINLVDGLVIGASALTPLFINEGFKIMDVSKTINKDEMTITPQLFLT